MKFQLIQSGLLCVLCELVIPTEQKGQHNDSGYETLAHNIIEFQKIDALPMDLDIDRIDDGSGFQLTLQAHNGKWHSFCYKKFSQWKLR